jgi:SH3-like domain-containing protein
MDKRIAAGLVALAAAVFPGLAAAQGAPGDAAPVTGVLEVAGTLTPRDPTRGAVTNLPLPRFVTLKTDEGYARRGPGLSHRIDWVFTRPGMPLKVTAEYEHWRRVEDAEGAGGWVHYALLSGTRSVLVVEDMTEFRAAPDPQSTPVLQAEYGVIARLLECRDDWCRLSVDGTRGWVPAAALWGVTPGETVE